MLKDFFKLNCPYIEFQSQEELTEPLLTSNDLRDVLYRPGRLDPPETTRPNNPFRNKTFTNVIFRDTTISGVEFRDCKFVDCLFIGTQFKNCQFHGCSFEGCNPHKAIFEDTYIDPAVFEGMLDPYEHWNIGIHLFQELYDNATKMHHREFSRTADFNRSKWNRYVLNHRYPGWEKTKPKYILEWSANFLYYIFAGYGIRSKFLFAWTSFLLVGAVLINFILWDSLGVVGRDGFATQREFTEVLYYTATIPTGLGDFTPTSDLGRIIFLFETLLSLGTISFFVNWLVKQASR